VTHVIAGADQIGFSKQDDGRLGLPGDRQEHRKVGVGGNQHPLLQAGSFQDDGILGGMQPVVTNVNGIVPGLAQQGGHRWR